MAGISSTVDREALFRCSIPEGQVGKAAIERYTISKDAASIGCIRGEYLLPGEFTRLMINGQLVMSDTPQEYRDHIAFFGRARGSVLIHGLGLGCALNVLLSMGHVNDITVVEVNPDVI